MDGHDKRTRCALALPGQRVKVHECASVTPVPFVVAVLVSKHSGTFGAFWRWLTAHQFGALLAP